MPHFFRREKNFSKLIQKVKKKERQINLLLINSCSNNEIQINDSVKNTSIN